MLAKISLQKSSLAETKITSSKCKWVVKAHSIQTTWLEIFHMLFFIIMLHLYIFITCVFIDLHTYINKVIYTTQNPLSILCWLIH